MCGKVGRFKEVSNLRMRVIKGLKNYVYFSTHLHDETRQFIKQK